MNKRTWIVVLPLLGALLLIPMLAAQPDFPPFGPGGPRGPGGPGGPMGQVRKLVSQFDKDGDGKLNKEERQAARDFLKKERAEGGLGDRGRRFGPPPGFGRENQEPAKPGPRVSPGDVQSFPDAGLYEPTVLRT